MKNKTFFTLVLLLSFFFVNAQEKEKKNLFSFEVIGDTYFKTNINSTNSTKTTLNTPSTAFADKNGFALGMINAIAKYETNKVELVGDFFTGPRAEQATTNSLINQLYVKYSPTSKIDITFGKFNTFLGYEIISPKGNFNYSTSYLFTNGPFSHTGITGKYKFSDDHSLLFAVMNANDDNKFNSNGAFTLGLQYSIKGQNINLVYGKKNDGKTNTGKSFQIDYTGGFNITNKFFLGINASYETTKDKSIDDNFGFYGVTLYGLFEISPKFKLGLRPEYFSRYVGSENNNYFAGTLSGNWMIAKNLRVIPEFRIDYNKNKPFVDNDLSPQKSLSSFLVGVVYNFEKSL
ncbi:MAG: porin [Tenacibaculum sp.]|nr:porin [Tenacibaculum sp.]